MRLVLPTSDDAQPDLCGLWVTLHAVYRQWSLARPDAPERKDIAAHLERQLAELAEVSAEDWAALLSLQGLTPLSLAAYSWCKGVSLSGLLGLWQKVHDAAQDAPDEAFTGLRFANPALLPERRVTQMLDNGFLHGWQMGLLSHAWAGQDVIHDVNQQFKPEIESRFAFVKERRA